MKGVGMLSSYRAEACRKWAEDVKKKRICLVNMYTKREYMHTAVQKCGHIL